MSTGNGSSMNPKPVPAWLNSAAWASTPRSPMRTSYSFGDRSSSASVLEPIGRPAGDYDDPLSNMAKPQEAVAPQEEIDATVPAPEPTQVCSCSIASYVSVVIMNNHVLYISLLDHELFECRFT